MNIILNCILIAWGAVIAVDVYRNLVSSAGRSLYYKCSMFIVGTLASYVTATNAIELIGRLLWNA